jgi:hypothetical protein
MNTRKQVSNITERILYDLFKSIGCDRPNNMNYIVRYIVDDVVECADPEEWHSGDIAIAFRRLLESIESE